MDNEGDYPRIWTPVIVVLVVSSVLVELALQGADAGYWGSTRMRLLTYQYTAFWPGLLDGWRPNYALQPYTMFLTYAFVHAGMAHLIGNMVMLVVLGRAVIRDVGQARFAMIYVASALIGAGIFAVLTKSYQPMVGASGAIFGLAGALICWNIRYTFRQNTGMAFRMASIVWPTAVLVLLHVAMIFGVVENVAWETHLGGFIAGFALAVFMRENDPPA